MGNILVSSYYCVALLDGVSPVPKSVYWSIFGLGTAGIGYNIYYQLRALNLDIPNASVGGMLFGTTALIMGATGIIGHYIGRLLANEQLKRRLTLSYELIT